MTPQEETDGMAVVSAIIEQFKSAEGALLPMLHALQDRLGHVPEQSIPALAAALNLSRAEVYGVVTFYHHFRLQPPGRHVMRICRAEACQANGAEALIDHAMNALGCGFHETTSDGAVTLEAAYCLGHCAVGPALEIDGAPRARMNAEKFDRLVDGLEARK